MKKRPGPAADESATRGVSPPGAPPTSPSTVTIGTRALEAAPGGRYLLGSAARRLCIKPVPQKVSNIGRLSSYPTRRPSVWNKRRACRRRPEL